MKIFACAFLSALALLTACGGAANNAGGPSAKTPNSAPADPSNSPSSGSTAANGDALNLAPGNSTVTFFVPRKTDRRQAGFTMFSGTFELAEGKPENSSLSIEVDTNTLFSDDQKFTEQMKGPEFLDVAKFPKATFRSTRIEPGAYPPDNYTISGDLQLRGQTKPVTFPALITVADNSLTLKAGFRLSRKLFDITAAGPADNPIRDDIAVMLDIKVPRRK